MRNYIKKADRLPPGPLPLRHGAFSVMHRAELIRRNPALRLFLKRTRLQLIRDLEPRGEAHLSAAKGILVDRVLSKLACVWLIEVWLSEHLEDLLAAGKVTGLWLSANNSIREDLRLLGLERVRLEAEGELLSPQELAAAVDVEEAGDCPSREANAPHAATHGEIRGDVDALRAKVKALEAELAAVEGEEEGE